MNASSDESIGAMFGGLLATAAVCVVGWQVYTYLRHDIWTPVSIITALQWMDMNWAWRPSDWLGFYNILLKIPLSVSLFVVGVVLSVIGDN